MPVNNDILEQFDKQRNRGTQGFGLFDGEKMNIVRAAKENKILKWLVEKDSSLIMFHHRFPTSTVNVKRAAHPMSTGKFFGNTCYVLVHNGVIRNSDDLFVKHCEEDIEYKTLLDDLSFNDSESLLWDFALTMEGKQDRMKSIGDLAFICVKLVDNKLDTLYFGRNNGRPLKFYRTSGKNATIELSSEGRGNDVKDNTLYAYNYKLKRLTKKQMAFTISTYKPYTSNYQSSYSYTPGGRTNSGFRSDFGRNRYDEDRRWGNDEYDEDDACGYGSYGEDTIDSDGNVWDYETGKFIKPVRQFHEDSGNWLGDVLRNKFQKFFDNNKVSLNVPSHRHTAPVVNKITPEYVADNIDKFKPTTPEIQNKVMAELGKVQGHFEQAYWSLEAQYIEVQDKPADLINIRSQLLLEACLAFIQSDTEYIDEESVSSIWRSLCHQQKLLTA